MLQKNRGGNRAKSRAIAGWRECCAAIYCTPTDFALLLRAKQYPHEAFHAPYP
jgi:hypothetical protein